MPFVKLDCGILRSTLWMDRDAREVFITALLMAEPVEYSEPLPEIATRSLDYTGWVAPPGWYGFVPAANVGIIHAAMIEREAGMAALEKLAAPDTESRSSEFEGRRLIRINGGYIVLNFIKYRDRDYTGAERAKRYREGVKLRAASRRDVTQSQRDTPQPVMPERDVRRDITQSECRVQSAEAESETETHKRGNGATAPDVPREAFEPPTGLDPEAWKCWVAYRQSIKKPLRPVSLPKAAKALAAYGPDQQAVVDQSIAAGWQGLFALKPVNGSTKPPPIIARPPPTADQVSAARAEAARQNREQVLRAIPGLKA